MNQEELLSRITIDPEICHGKPCIRGLRYPVVSILEYLAAGDTTEDILAAFTDLEEDDIRACLAFAILSIQTRDHIVSYDIDGTPRTSSELTAILDEEVAAVQRGEYVTIEAFKAQSA